MNSETKKVGLAALAGAGGGYAIAKATGATALGILGNRRNGVGTSAVVAFVVIGAVLAALIADAWISSKEGTQVAFQ